MVENKWLENQVIVVATQILFGFGHHRLGFVRQDGQRVFRLMSENKTNQINIFAEFIFICESLTSSLSDCSGKQSFGVRIHLISTSIVSRFVVAHVTG